jgi:hypothetical protein
MPVTQPIASHTHTFPWCFFFSLFIYSYVHTLFESFLPYAPSPLMMLFFIPQENSKDGCWHAEEEKQWMSWWHIGSFWWAESGKSWEPYARTVPGDGARYGQSVLLQPANRWNSQPLRGIRNHTHSCICSFTYLVFVGCWEYCRELGSACLCPSFPFHVVLFALCSLAPTCGSLSVLCL